MVTLRDIAAKLNLSVATISKVLNHKADKYRISKKTQKLVIKTAKEMGYYPNELARNLRKKESKTIGLIVPDILQSRNIHIHRVIQKRAFENGYHVIYCDSGVNGEQEKEYLELLYRRRVDGIIFSPVGNCKKHILKYFNNDMPMVIVNRNYRNLNIDTVLFPIFETTYFATKYLIKKGHKRIAYAQGYPTNFYYDSGLKGYKAALRDHGIKINDSYITVRKSKKEGDGDREGIYGGTISMLSSGKPPTAFVAFGPFSIFDVYSALVEKKSRIPENISLVDIKYMKNDNYFLNSLTTVFIPVEKCGAIMIDCLLGE